MLQRFLDATRAAYAVPPEAELVAAPGTQALIQWLPRLLPPGPIAIAGPTYDEHGISWRGPVIRSSTSRRTRWSAAFPRGAAIS